MKSCGYWYQRTHAGGTSTRGFEFGLQVVFTVFTGRLENPREFA